jgi:hypothetical protein
MRRTLRYPPSLGRRASSCTIDEILRSAPSWRLPASRTVPGRHLAHPDSRRRRLLRMADRAAPIRLWPRRRDRRQPRPARSRPRARGRLADSDPADRHAPGLMARGLRQGDRLPPLQRGGELPGHARPDPRLPARLGCALRRAAGGSVLDEELVAQALHGLQQRQRDSQPARRGRRVGRQPPCRAPGNDGRLRLRHRRDQDPRGLPGDQDRRR